MRSGAALAAAPTAECARLLAPPAFVHLRVPSHYSLGRSIIRIRPLVTRVRELGMGAAALTDLWNLAGAAEFSQEAAEAGIRPIFGMALDQELLVLAEDDRGYRNLMALSSVFHARGGRLNERDFRDLLSRYHGGLIALSGCPRSGFGHACLSQDTDGASEIAARYSGIFGAHNFFIEVRNLAGRPPEEGIRRAALHVARRLGIPLVATDDARYLRREDSVVPDSRERHLKSPAEMARLFADIPEALANAVAVAERCRARLPGGGPAGRGSL